MQDKNASLLTSDQSFMYAGKVSRFDSKEGRESKLHNKKKSKIYGIGRKGRMKRGKGETAGGRKRKY